MVNSEYSASMVSTLFWWLETRKTAEMLLSGINNEEIQRRTLDENIFQVRAVDRRKRILNLALRRLKALPKSLIESLIDCDSARAKLIVLMSICKTDKLFFEFCYEVYYNAIVLGSFAIVDSEVNLFFNRKIQQSEKVAGFSETSIYKLKQTYTKVLFEAGVLSDAATDRKVLPPYVDDQFKKLCKENGMHEILRVLTGDRL